MSSPIPDILVVDDHAPTLAWLVETLTGEGFRVRPADSGALALASVQRRTPDLILLDVRMEGLDGLEICRRLKADPATRHLPVIFMSGQGEVDDRVLAFKAGGMDFILKPPQPEELLVRVRTALQLSASERHLHQQDLELRKARLRLADEETFHLGAQAILEATPALVYAFDMEGRFLLANQATLRAIGTTETKALGQLREAVLPPEIAAAHRADDLVVLSSRELREFEERNLQPDGEHIYWSVKFPICDSYGEPIGVGGVSTDITKLRRLEEEQDRLTRLYASLSQANQAMLLASDEQDLFQAICRIGADAGQFDLAWVGRPDEKGFTVLAADGKAKGYLDGLELGLDGADPRGCNPAAEAVRSGDVSICQDWLEDPRMAPWRERGLRFGLRSSAAFPVRCQGHVVAVLGFYSQTKDYFTPERVTLLTDLAGNLSFAMEKFRADSLRTATEIRLQEEKLRYQDLVSAQPAGIYRIRILPLRPVTGEDWEQEMGRGYRVEFVSDQFCTILGLTREAFQGDPALILTRIHPEDRPAFSTLNAECLSSGRPFHWEGRLQGSASSQWIRFESMPRFLEDGGTLWTGIISDITAEREAQESARAQHALMVNILENTEGPFFSIDTEYRYTSFNSAHASAMLQLYGSRVHLGDSLLEAMTNPSDREKAKRNLDLALNGESRVEESLTGDPERGLRRFEVTHNPIRSAQGAVIGVSVFAQDTTERRKLEQDLLDQGKRLKTIFGTTRDGVWLLDARGTVIEINEAASTMLGYEMGELLGRSVRDVEAQETPSAIEERLVRVLAGAPEMFESLHRKKDGRLLPVEVSVASEESGQHLVVFVRDISERKVQEEKIRCANDLLRQSQGVARVGGWEYLPDTGALWWTPEAFRILDLDPGELLPSLETTLEFYAQPGKRMLRSAVEEAVAKGTPWSLEAELITALGRHLWVRTAGEAIMQGGRVTRVIGTFMDMSTEHGARVELEKTLQKYRLLTESMKDVVWTLDAETLRFTYVSPSVQRLRGYTADEIMAVAVDDALGEEAGRVRGLLSQRVQAFRDGSLRPGTFFTEEVEQPCKDGSTVWTEVITTYFNDQATGHVSVLGVTRDVSERRHIQDALVESEAQFRTLATTSPVGIFLTDAMGLTRFINERQAQLLGMSAPEAMELGWIGAIHPDDREFVAQEWAACAREDRPYRVNCRILHADGTLLYAIAEARSIRNQDGQITAWVGTVMDITDLTQSQAELLRREQRYRAIFNTAADGLVLIDRETARFLDANPAFCSLYGYSREMLLEMTAMDVSAEPEHTQAATQGGASRVGLRWHRTRDGRIFPVEMVADGFEMDGRLVNVVSIRDISERLRLETELQELNRELERRVELRTRQLEAANQELEAFAYSVSHDLRAPLRTVAGFAEALSRDADLGLTPSGAGHLKRIQGGAVRMSQLIDDLLHLSRIGRDELTNLPVDLASLSEQILNKYREEEPHRQVHSSSGGELRVSGDPRLLRVLLENLLQNAWKFTNRREPARITLQGRPRGDGMVEITLEDNGAGFPPELVGRLFTPFQRLHREEDFPGTGIGLAIAKRIVGRHGGHIQATGSPGEGATITFTLPVAGEAAR